ncbi:MAG: hypothetical protein MRZ79_06310 [Bacteroidia bacterium]|nr:hypothetical protein [Bacteroidia bacterium]
MIKQFLIGMFVICWLSGSLFGQNLIDLEVGVSKSDQVFGRLSYTFQFKKPVRLGFRLGTGDIQYRFVDARNVDNGTVLSGEILSQFRLSDNGDLSLYGFFNLGLRFIQLNAERPSEITNYAFQNSQAVTLDPGIVVHIKASETFNVFSGINMHMAIQYDPSVILEQQPSGYLLFGASLKTTKRSLVFVSSKIGSTYGAGGDTEKFFWSLQAGVRFSLNSSAPINTIPNF